MGTKILFWLIFYPLSLLPLRLLYAIAYVFYLISHYLIKYRRKVITDNLQKSFPEKSIKEIAELRRLFYYHLAHIAAEMMKMLTINQKELKKMFLVRASTVK
jgi:KDO2-lipid IV(A) lauroyltransferase